MRWLLIKDLRVLRRSPVLAAVLVIYPLVIALLIGAAISSPPGKPTVAIYSGVPAGQGGLKLGHQRIRISEYASQLYRSVRPLHAGSAATAISDVRSGRALAAVIIPADIDRQIQSLITTGEGNPRIRIVVNDRNPLERELVEQALQTRLDQVQNGVSKLLLAAVINDLHTVLAGGRLSFLGDSLELLGLRNTRTIVAGAVAALGRRSALGPALEQVVRFANVTIDGLALAVPQIHGIDTPLTVDQTQLNGRTTPTASYAIAIAAVFLVMFVALVLGATMLAFERSENAYDRLVRGLVSPRLLLAEKVVLAAFCAAVMTLAMSAAISSFVALDWGRVELWVLTLTLAALSFAALGVMVGAGAREVGVAALLAFLVSLPLAFAALVPGESVGTGTAQLLHVLSFLFPFAPALSAVSTSFTGSGPQVWLPLLHLLVQTGIYLALARLALRRLATT